MIKHVSVSFHEEINVKVALRKHHNNNCFVLINVM